MFNVLKNALSKTSSALVKSVLDVVDSATGKDEIDEFELEDIEALLIKADLGIELSLETVNKIKEKKIKKTELENFLKEEFSNILNLAGNTKLLFDKNKLNIYFITGVNGAGKTTLIGRLAHKFKNEGRKVLLAAGDTFRAAAEEQLDIWAKRAEVEIVRRDKADSASVVFEAIQKAKNENFNVLIIDTAGRLQNKFNLVEELKKIKNVISKNAENAIVESILVLDANLGQNGLMQAKVFNEAIDLTSVALTKLDGSAKGGIILAVAKDYNLPTKLIGVGEKNDDLKDFSKEEFIEAIF
ncbi:MAG: signal recognition particle-docking protein FtsY [Candidatus Gastranaerophilales bacterium]|nr:signal recognition particle-docking protein FtsY [Candidatus Gastranaerophilales bacterium]